MSSMRRFAPLAALCAAGCLAHAGGGADLTRADSVAVGDATFRVTYSPEDAEAAVEIERGLERAVPRARRWGGFRAPVTITIYPTHKALEEAVGREGYDWLRAWARYGTVDLQSPRTWSLFGGTEDAIVELLSHELTHCVMYQQAGSEWTWAYKSIPLWFREGMASVSAGQAYRRSGPVQLFEFYEGPEDSVSRAFGLWLAESLGLASRRCHDELAASGPREPPDPSRPRRGGDPVSDPDPLYQCNADVVYGAAHWAFQFLLDRYGEDRVRRILTGMGDGHLFSTAFQQAIGISVEEFEADFKRYVIWQGWRSARR